MIKNILKKIKENNADFALLNSIDEFSLEHSENTELAILTGFTGTAGEALVDKFGKIYLFVDPRYHITAKSLENDGLVAVLLDMGEGFLDGFKKIAPKNSKILIPNTISHNRYLKYKEYYGNLQIVDALNDKNPDFVKIYSVAENTEATKNKIERIKSEYGTNYLITSLDEIAYLLDLRGDEYNYMSSFSAKFLLGKNILFTDCKIPKNLDFIEILPLFKFENYMKNIKETILVDSYTINEKTYAIIQNPKEDNKKIIKYQMAIKSDREINHLKYAFSKLDEAIFAFRAKIQKGMTEIDLKNLFETELYSTGASGLSFKTLLAVCENSASIHYSSYSIKKIEKSGDIILLDCGGYWDFGLATDITRVFAPFGATYKQKQIYTLVLKSQIVAYLSNSNSPYELDKVARDYLISNAPSGFEFSHALGHGVGLSVHQDPPTLSPRTDKHCTIEPNMVFTIEPGLYKDGEFGIRLENTCYIDKNNKKISLSHFPYERNLIDYDMLNEQEIEFLENWGLND